MTDSQIKYQSLVEDQRHNLAMERLGRQELGVKKTQAAASMEQAIAAQRQAGVREDEAALKRTQYKTSVWQTIGSTGEKVYNAVQTIWGNSFGFLGNVINALKGVGSTTGTSNNSKPLFS